MKDIWKDIDRYLGLLFAGILILFSSGLTFLMAGRLVPGKLILQLAAVFLFDGGALCWFLRYIRSAKGSSQWAQSIIGFAVSLLGAAIMASGELLMTQNLVALDTASRGTLGWILIGTMVFALVVHITLVYLFPLSDPDLQNNMESTQMVAKIMRIASADAHAELERKAHELGRGIADSVYAKAVQQIETATAVHIRQKRQEKVKTDTIMRDAVIMPGGGPEMPYRPLPMTASPAAGRPQGNRHTPKQNPPKRPQGVREHSFGGNGRGSSEHDAFAAAPTSSIAAQNTIKEKDHANPTPPHSEGSPRS
jgi:hypothetical protein